MMVGCSAFGCKSRSEKKDPGITFHRFPINDPRRLARWVQKMNRSGWSAGKNDKLCSKHFDRSSFYNIGERTCLLDDAVPTIFEELPKYIQEIPETKRARKRSRQETEEPYSCSTSVKTSCSTSVVPSCSASVVPTSVSKAPNVEQTSGEAPKKKQLRRQLFQAEVMLNQKEFKL